MVNFALLLKSWAEMLFYKHLFVVSKVGDRSRGRPEGSPFNNYYAEV